MIKIQVILLVLIFTCFLLSIIQLIDWATQHHKFKKLQECNYISKENKFEIDHIEVLFFKFSSIGCIILTVLYIIITILIC